MQRTGAVLVVGNRHWGKSTTLRALTGNTWGTVSLPGIGKVFVRLMSNDDEPDDYAAFIDGLDPKNKPFVIMAYCPENADNPRLFKKLSKKYPVVAWVLEHKFGKSPRSISRDSLRYLSSDQVSWFNKRGAEATHRAASLEKFIVSQWS
jgi:hypothetical protein